MTKRIGESGNIFFTLFGAVALVGIIGVATSNLMRGPVGTVMKLNQQAKAESQLQIARKMAALESAQQLTSDCDPDTYLEPLPPDVAGACAALGLTGGGCLPASVGASKNDPWGTRVGYCAWDHGPPIGTCDPNLLDGTNAATETVIAVISAGPDRTFQTTCGDDPAYVTKGGDDIVMEWTYDDAVQGAGGLWALKSSDPNTAEILNNRNIEVGGTASFQSSASFARDVAFGAGSYLDLTAGSLLNLPDQTVLAVCNAANDRALRVDLSVGMVLQICQDGVGWVDIGGSGAASSVYGVDGDVQFNSGDTLYAIDTFNYDVGANRLRVGGNTAADDTLEVTGTADISGDLQANQINIVTGGNAAGVGLSFNSAGTLGLYGSGSTVGLAVGGSTRLSATSTGAGVTGNLSVSGTGSIGGTLGVSGKTTISNDLDVTGAFQVDGDISDSNSAVTVNDDLVVNQSLQVGTSFAAQNFELVTIGSGEGMYLYTSGAGTGLALNTSGLNRLTIDGSGNSKFTGDVGVGISGSPTTGLDVGTLFRLRSDLGVVAGTACALDGSITYTSGDELLICSNITGNWETIGTSGGGGGGGAGIWERTTGTIRINPTYFNDADNFVVGSTQLDDEGSGAQDERMLFENATGAFRAGVANGTEWDTRGNYSAAFGLNTQATADSTFAVGNNAQARATEAVAMGRDVIVAAGALNSMAFGLGTAAGAEPQVTGTESLGIFMQDQSGVSLAANNTVGIFGGKLMIDPNAAATQVAASGSLTVDVEGDVGAIQFCSEDGTFCFTAQDVATGATGAPGNDREVVFNSAGSLYTNTSFVYTSAGFLGLGTDTPRARVHAYNGGSTASLLVEGDEAATSDLNLLTSGNGASTVGDATATGWTFSARGNSFATASVQNDLMYYYWNGTSYQQRFLLENDTGNLVLSDTDVVGDTKLDVDGTIKMSYGGESCDANREGAIRFMSSDNSFYVCQALANGWQRIITAGSSGAGIPAGGADREIQFNSGGDLAGISTFVLTSAGRFGLGTATPAQTFDVTGTANVTGAATLGSSLDVTGQVNFSSSLNVTNATVLSNTLDVTGATTLNNTLDVVGANATTLGGSLGVTGQVDFSSGLNVANATVLSDVLYVSGAATLASSLDVTGQVNFSSGLNVTNATVLSNTLDVTGATTLNGLLTTTADANLGGLVTFTSSGAVLLPVGDTGQRPNVPSNGMIRYNTDNGKYEAFQGGIWQDILTSAVVGGAGAPDRGVQFNSGGNFAAEANFTYTSAGDLIVGSYQIEDTGTGIEDSRMFFDVSNSAFRAGIVDAGQWDYASSGQYSAAFGQNNIASGTGSFSIGNNNIASGNESFAGGGSSVASGAGSFAMGFATASGDRSVAMGLSPIASNTGSVALGGNSTASGQYSVAIGASNTASSSWATAIGIGNNASGTASTALGAFNVASGTHATTLGMYTSAGDYSLSVGLSSGFLANKSRVSGQQSYGIFMGNQDNVDLTSNNTMGLYGGSMIIDPAIPATDVVADTALDVNGTIKMSYGSEACDANRIGAVQYSSGDFYLCQNGTSWQRIIVAGAGGTGLPASGNDREIQFNSGGDLAASSTFVLTSAGNLGVGTAAPVATARVTIDTGVTSDSLIEGYMNTNASRGMYIANSNSGANAQATYEAENDAGSVADFGIGSSGGLASVYGNRAYAWTGGATSGLSIVAANAASDIRIFTGGETAADERMRIGSTGLVTFSSTGAFVTNVGTTAQRPSAVQDGMFRFNSDTNQFEGYNGTDWNGFMTGAAGVDRQILFNSGGAVTGNADLVFEAAGNVNIGAGNFYFTSAGRLGINTTTPTTTGAQPLMVDVEGATGAQYFCDNNGNNCFTAAAVAGGSAPAPGTDTQVVYNSGGLLYARSGFVFNSAGNLGVGEDSPDERLVVSGNAATLPVLTGNSASGALARFYNADGQTARIVVDGVGGTANLSLRRANGTTAAPSQLLTDDDLGMLAFFGYGTTGYSNAARAKITAGASEDWTDAAQGTYLQFATTAIGDNSIRERMRIDDVGNVGIGIKYSSAKLDVAGTIKMAYGGETCNANTEGAIRYDSGSNTFSFCALTANDWEAISLGAGTLAALSDTTISGPANGQVLYYSGGSWINNALALNGLSDVDTTGFADGNVLLYSAGAGGWVPGTASSTFIGLTDTPSVYTGQSGKFARVNSGETALEFTDQVIESVTGANAPTTFDLNDLGDVTSSGATDAQVLQYDSASGNWVAATLAANSVAAAGADTQIQFNSGGAFAASSTFVYTSAGHLGIGTSTPGEILMISSGLAGPTINVQYSGVDQYGGPELRLSRTDIFTNRNNGRIVFEGGGTTGIESWTDTADAAGAELRFITDPNGAGPGPVTVMVLKQNGFMGLGTTSPVETLDVVGGIKFSSSSLACNSTTHEGAMQFGSGGSKIFEVCADSTNGWEQLALGGTVAGAFTDLSDTPSTYTGQAGKFAVVNSGETAISFTDSVIENVAGEPAPDAININDLGDVSVGGATDAQVLQYDSATGNWVASSLSSGSVTAAGANGQIQYNSNGSFAASSTFVYTSAGRLGLGVASPNVALDVVGDIEYTGTITDVSDMRLKTDITPLDTDEIMKRLAQIDTYTFRMKDDPKGRIEFGVMAQELEKVFPELVKTANDEMGTKSVNYVGLIAPLVKASQELQSENDDLRAQIAEMKTSQAQFQKDIMQEVNGLKAYTGYGISKAQIGLWMLVIMFGSLSLYLVVGGIVRNRRNKHS